MVITLFYYPDWVQANRPMFESLPTRHFLFSFLRAVGWELVLRLKWRQIWICATKVWHWIINCFVHFDLIWPCLFHFSLLLYNKLFIISIRFMWYTNKISLSLIFYRVFQHTNISPHIRETKCINLLAIFALLHVLLRQPNMVDAPSLWQLLNYGIIYHFI